jgi:hypothetical protein
MLMYRLSPDSRGDAETRRPHAALSSRARRNDFAVWHSGATRDPLGNLSNVEVGPGSALRFAALDRDDISFFSAPPRLRVPDFPELLK